MTLAALLVILIATVLAGCKPRRLLSATEALLGPPGLFDVLTPQDQVDVALIGGTHFADGTPRRWFSRDIVVVDPNQIPHAFSEGDGSIVDGHIKIVRPPLGRYQVFASRIFRLRPSKEKVNEGEEVVFTLETENYLDGTPVRYQVCESGHSECGTASESGPGTGATSIYQDRATFRWSYVQPLGQAVGGKFIAIARVKSSVSNEAEVQPKPFPLKDLRGAQQVLRKLGYGGPGPASGVLDATTQKAILSFQTNNDPCQFSIADEDGHEPCRQTLCGGGGLNAYPEEERGRIGPMTRRTLECVGTRW